MTSFIEAIEAPLMELYIMRMEDNFNSYDLKLYTFCIESYLRAEKDELYKLIDEVPHYLKDLVTLRYQIVIENIDLNLLSRLENSIGEMNEWDGEIAFVSGLACWSINDNHRAFKNFQCAYKKLWELGAKKKAVKALMNVVVSESRVDNTKRCITSYEFVKDKAQEIGDKVIAGICYHNMAKEYLKLNSAELSLKYSNHALELLQVDRGAIHYYEVLLHRCHSFIQMGRFHEALADFQTAKASKNIRIQNALKAIELILENRSDVKIDHLEPAWRTKLSKLQQVVKIEELTKLETQFIETISKGQIPKNKIIEVLYGDKIDPLSAENRFNVFLTRFKKKFSGVVVSDNGVYSLANNAMIESLQA